MNGFPKNARVCFIGDSITHNNGFVSYISAYYHEYLKDRKVNFYNCGVAGGRTRTALCVMDKDVFPHNPTHAVKKHTQTVKELKLDATVLTTLEKALLSCT